MKDRANTGKATSQSRSKRNISQEFVLSWKLPETTGVPEDSVLPSRGGGIFKYAVRMKLGHLHPILSAWEVPPHQAFANLKVVQDPEEKTEVVDPHSMPQFFLRYGQLGFECESEFVESASTLTDDEGVSIEPDLDLCQELTNSRSAALIRYVWRTGSDIAIEALALSGERGSRIRIDSKTGLATPEFLNTWSLICYLTVKDQRAGRMEICANPGCKAPYFLKTRRTQKICENPECAAWAQRRYALKWWQENNRKPKNAAQ